MLVALLVVVLQILAGGLLMAAQVVIGTVSNAPQLAPAAAEGELVLNIGSSTGIESQLSGIMVTQPQRVFLNTQTDQPVFAEVLPVGKPFQIGTGLAEEFTLHLLKLTGTEGEVTGRDLVTESLTHLTDTERQLLTGGTLDVGKVNKDTLGGFGTQVSN